MTRIRTRFPPCAAAEGSRAVAAPVPTIGTWQLLRLASNGPLACVYRVRPANAPADRPGMYALKALHGHWEDSPAAVDTIRVSECVSRQVRHPHLLPIVSAQAKQPPYFLVMPWLEGWTLEQRLRAGQRFAPARALWFIRQAAGALAALHEAGWVHGDVKPANLHLSSEGHVTLLDLGFARRPGEAAVATDRPVLGTLAYMPPESLTSSWSCDIRGDIYSLGATLFELLTGRPPFIESDSAALVLRHRCDEPPSLAHCDPRIPIELDRLVQQMLSKHPLRRPGSPRELMDRLATVEIQNFTAREAG